ncbi:MAG: bifunctional folylpolyglutamate synthase/dihydrofolate synthase [Thermodesulfobacteriota bacterium]
MPEFGFKNFSHLQAYLSGLGMFHMELGLSRIETALGCLGTLGDAPLMVHVLGTNGKGSTAFYLREISGACGIKAGLFTSPHLVDLRERISVAGKMLAPGRWLQAANLIESVCGDLGLTYFEFLTLMAHVIFVQEKVELAVFEAGLGGRFDATNVFDFDLTVFTSLGRDHCNILGETQELIARDKSGAIKGAPVVSAPQTRRVREILQCAAKEKDTSCFFLPQKNYASFLSLNHNLARTAFLTVFPDKSQVPALSNECKQNAFIVPGRLHRVCRNPEIILDGAHNPHALQALYQALERACFYPDLIVFNCFADKDVQGMCAILQKFCCPVFVFTPEQKDRAYAAEEILHCLGPRAELINSTDWLKSKFNSAGKRILVCGSVYLLGRIYSLFPGWIKSGENI